MKFERIKKSHKKEIIIGGMIVLGIISAITITTSRAKYRLTQSIPIVRGTVNYKQYDFKIMAMYKQKDGSTCTQDSCYDEITGEMPSSGYVVNEDKSYCLTSNNEQVKGKVKTIDGNHIITGLKKNDKCYIWFDKKNTIEETLAKLNITNYNTTAPDFSKTATTDEGVYRVEDKMYGGYSYYWRGAVTNNHVIFAGYCWRIVRINGDGTIRLIYNGAKSNYTCKGNGTSIANAVGYSAYSSSGYGASAVGWTYTKGQQRPENATAGTAVNAKIKTDGWFDEYIAGANTGKVADGKFCNDREEWQSSGKFDYAAKKRLNLNNPPTPTLDCPEGDIYILKVGAITADEVSYAGGLYNNENKLYYLYNGYSYWSMSPDAYSSYPFVLTVESNGSLSGGTVDVNASFGLRPVINLRSDVTFNLGSNGTQNNPYIVQ